MWENMARLTFFGGIHPRDNKAMTKGCQVRTLFPENGALAFPLQQHIGQPSIPVVREGDYVRTGQLIARADGALSSNLHASVSGCVLGVREHPVAGGTVAPCIMIENDGLYLEVPYPENRRLEMLSRQTVLNCIRNAGIVGMGGSGIPTHYKLLGAANADVDTIIANCVECEPYLTSDYRRVLENPWKVINGLMVLLTLFPRARGFIAVSEKNIEGYRVLRELLQGSDRIFVKRCKDKYPQGSERQLIYALTGRTLNAKMLPYEIGCLVCNTDTLVAINQAVIMHEPLITRIITVTGGAMREPGNFRVRLGMTYRDVLEQAGGFQKGLSLRDVTVIDGGPMMGRQLRDLNVPITKMSSAIVCLKKSSIPLVRESACTRCGRCAEVCPNHLVPLQLEQDIKRGSQSAFIGHNGLECCNCGSCTYVCPSGILLSSHIDGQRRKIMQKPHLAGDYARRITR